ncbi:MAG: phosphoribosylanthranilate isomerase [Smithellaceae bacterium]|nr:phosphoribosylanthranilate isomerase [Smithellaceae bacterium]
MTEVKICGITNMEDAIACARAGASALGFIFYRESPRYVAPELARDISARLPDRIIRVGVFVNAPPSEAREVADYCGLDMWQFHGQETPAYCAGFDQDRVIKAIFSQESSEMSAIAEYQVQSFLIDVCQPGMPGGTGRIADWSLARELARNHPLILAGGLNLENIDSALARVRPGAVDINSGVEISPGKKDHRLVAAIIARIKKHKNASSPYGPCFNPYKSKSNTTRASRLRAFRLQVRVRRDHLS